MIDRLSQISAPNDFDFRVKARIANARPADFQTRFLPALKYILPIGIFVMLIGLIAFNTNYFSNNQSIESPVAQTLTESKTTQETVATNNTSTNSPDTLAFTPSGDNKSVFAPPSNDDKSLNDILRNNRQPLRNNLQNETAQVLPRLKTKPRGRNSLENEGGGSRDSSVGSKNGLLPSGINLNQSKTKDEMQNLLEFFGIETVLINGKQTVKSFSQTSSAPGAGLRIGDVIEKISTNSISILRGTEQLEINLQNNVTKP